MVKTSNSNTFNKTLNPPTALARVTVLTQNLGSTTQDYYQFDGSDSVSDNTIVGWYWTVLLEDNSVENVISGKAYQYYPLSNGPYKIKLTVTDNSGLNGTSNIVSMPYDSKLTSSPTPTVTPSTLTAVAGISVLTQNIGAIRRDYLVLDGSNSFGGSPIIDWDWTIYDGSNTSSYPGNWSDESNVKIYPYSGKIIQYFPGSSGPFIINLTIKNSTGQTNSAINITVPADDYFNPPVYITIENDTFNNIIVHVWDITHSPMNNRAVNIIPQYGNLNLTPFSANTNSTGIAIFHVNSGGGTVIATTGSISTTPFAYTYIP
jgi:hypothetical protein